MKYFKYFAVSFLKKLKQMLIGLLPLLFVPVLVLISLAADGYTLEDFGLDGVTLNPSDYCNLTDVDYTAILHDDPTGKANVEITEYLTFDVHSNSPSNPYKELWRELPEDTVDGLRVTYNVKSVSQILADGTEVPYTETSKMYWEDEDYTITGTKRWHHSKGSGHYPDNDESLLIYIPWTYRETMKFKIVYSLNNAALKYNDCSELYLSLFSGRTITKLNSYKAQILIPEEIMPSEYYTYSFGTSNSRIPYTESKTVNPGYTTFSIDLDKSELQFNLYNRYIEFCLLSYGDDKHIFTKYAPNNMYSDEDALLECIAENEYYETQTKRFKDAKNTMFLVSIVLTAIVIYGTINKCKKLKEKYKFCEPETDYEYFREIPSDLDPMFASELVFMKNPFDENKEKKEEYSAILLSLMRKQYVKLQKQNELSDWSSHNTLISLEPIRTVYEEDSDETNTEPISMTINENTGSKLEPLTTSERLYLELLERHIRKTPDNFISISKLQNCIDTDYAYTSSFVRDMEKKPIVENGAILGYLQQSNYDVIKKKVQTSARISLTYGIFLLTLVNLISFFTPVGLIFGGYTILGIALIWKYFYFTIKANDMILFTQLGVNEQAKWYGLYNFLNSDTLINEKNVHELPLWEKYLIYATAFGISEKVIKAIKIHAAELNIDESSILNHHCYVHSHHFHTTSRSLGRSIHTSSRGGGFAGHGYGGGGRGGGGGGGGH